MKQNVLLFMAGLHAVLLVTASIVGTKVTQLGPFALQASFLLLPLAFTLINLITEHHGKKAARVVITNSTIIRAFFFVCCVPFALALPTTWEPAGYDKIFAMGIRLFLAGEVAIWVTQFFMEIPFFCYLRKKVGFGSTFLATTFVTEPMSMALFAVLAFAGTGAPLLRVTVSKVIVAALSRLVIGPVALLANRWLGRLA